MILVLATGRSGTSEVAEILRDLGVNMGSQFHIGDEFNPRGYFEDREFQEINIIFTMMGLNDIDTNWSLWKDRFDKLVSTRTEPWGLKDPGIADFPKLLNEYMKLKPSIVLCSRDREDTIHSLKRFKGIKRKKAEHIYDNRLKNINNILKGVDYIEIGCYDKDKEAKLFNWLNKYEQV